jgi:hypothetical protein
VAACGLVVAGCGGGGSSATVGQTVTNPANVAPKTIAKTALIAKGDAICAQINAGRNNSVGKPPANIATASGAELATVAAYYQKVIPYVNEEISSLRALGNPDKDATQYQAVLGNLAGEIAAMTASAQEARAGQQRPYAGAQDLLRRLSTAAQASAKTFGFSVCGS